MAAWPDLPFVNDTTAGWAKLSQMGGTLGGRTSAASAGANTRVILNPSSSKKSSADRAVRQIVAQGRLGKAVDLLVTLSRRRTDTRPSTGRW